MEGNALRLDWKALVPNVSYIIGNPPFVGYSLQSQEQKADILDLYRDENGQPYKTAGKIDYVAGWYWKSAEYMATSPKTCTALVSTNSITQGEQVASVWRPLVERFNITIDFAHRTFRWDSESNSKAHVHCVIIGFSVSDNNNGTIPPQPIKPLYDGERVSYVSHINAYLLPVSDIWIESRNKPLCKVSEIRSGGKPVEGGHLIFTSEEKTAFLKEEPSAAPYFRFFTGAEEYINGIDRWCLWFVGISPKELRNMPHVMERVASVREMRLASVKPATRKAAETPWLFMEIKVPGDDFLLIPATSSEARRYIPIGWMPKDVIPNNATNFIPSATLYDFGVLTSNVHNAWMRAVAGRLEMRYRYSAQIVYNNFPWPKVTDEQKARIEQTAQAILDARAQYPEASLADLYDELTMPPELRTAHQSNDRAVMAAYGFSTKMMESECVAELFKLYQALVASKQGDKSKN